MLFEQTPVGQAPSRAAPSQEENAETMWSGLLALIRALILGRRLPPDQLRMFLLFAPPVEYLSSEQIAELLGKGCGEVHELEPALPHGWTQGPSVNDPDSCDWIPPTTRRDKPSYSAAVNDLFQKMGMKK